jgi:hypothetical protein
MIDNIRVISWLFLCLLFELLVISAVSPFRGGEREALGKSAIVLGAQPVKITKTSAADVD